MAGVRKDKVLNLRVASGSHELWKAAAAAGGVSLSRWISDTLDAALESPPPPASPGESVVERGVYAPFVPSSGPSRVIDEAGVVHTVLGPVAPSPVRVKPADCSRGRFHRAGVWCKLCGYSG